MLGLGLGWTPPPPMSMARATILTSYGGGGCSDKGGGMFRNSGGGGGVTRAKGGQRFKKSSNHLAEVARSKPGGPIYTNGKTPHPPPPPVIGLLGPICIVYPKRLNCWFIPCKIIILPIRRIP